MRRVIELHIKAFAETRRKFTGRRRDRSQVVVTDRAHRALLVGKLVQMTADA